MFKKSHTIKQLVLMSLCFVCLDSLKAQSILAGQHGPNDYFNDPQDLTYTAPVSNSITVYPLDINGDGVTDFEFNIMNGPVSMFYNYNYLGLKPLKTNQVGAFIYKDSCVCVNATVEYIK